MAVYQGARLRATATPATGSSARQARATAPPRVSSAPRVRPMGLLMAVIVAATMLGLVYLTQTLGANATTTEIYVLEGQRGEIVTDIKRLQIAILKANEPEVIVPKAQKQKLKKLGGITVLPAP
jgi:hypothetical protein